MGDPAKQRAAEAATLGYDADITAAQRGRTAPEKLPTLPTLPPSPEWMRQQAPPTAEFEGQTRVGRYELVSRLGEGGMGVVYSGYDALLDRRVALKVLRRELGNKAWLLREGQALARLAHPNVVGIHEVGEQDGHVFLAMEYVEGSTLREWLVDRRHTVAETLRIFLEAGRGLVAAHAAGLVHRDFKPDNVLIGTDGRVRVGDFGIATSAGRASGDVDSGAPPSPGNLLDSPLTHAGKRVGTPAFMSPEQFLGETVTAQSDQWSFCVALYEAIYQARPFAATTVQELQRKVLSEAPANPPALPEHPPWLAPILLRGLSRNPAERFPSMEALLQAISAYLPRHPEMDPARVLRERQIMSGIFVAVTTLYSCLYLTDRGARVLLSPVGLIAMPLLISSVLTCFLALRWKKLTRNAYGRQLAELSGGMITLVLFNHIIGLRLSLAGPEILIQDLILVTTFYGVVASTMERWMGWLSAVSGLAALAATFAPARAALAFGIAGLVNAAGMGLRLYLDRHLQHEGEAG